MCHQDFESHSHFSLSLSVPCERSSSSQQTRRRRRSPLNRVPSIQPRGCASSTLRLCGQKPQQLCRRPSTFPDSTAHHLFRGFAFSPVRGFNWVRGFPCASSICSCNFWSCLRSIQVKGLLTCTEGVERARGRLDQHIEVNKCLLRIRN